MKLRPYPVSLNGNQLEPDQFGFHVVGGEPIDITFVCPNRKSQCVVVIKRGDADQATLRHGWNGDRIEPTITPSIGCDHAPRCGWHGHITNGERIP